MPLKKVIASKSYRSGHKGAVIAIYSYGALVTFRLLLLFATVQSYEPRINTCSVSPSRGLF
jgi:hypothetical protein